MKSKLLEIAFDSMEGNKEGYISNDKSYIEASERVADTLEDIGEALAGDSKELLKRLGEELGRQTERRDSLMYELGLKQGAILVIAERDIKKSLRL